MGSIIKQAAVVAIILTGAIWYAAVDARPAAEPSSEGAKVLTGPELVKMLEGLGYEPKELKDDKNAVTGGQFKFEGKSYTYAPSFILSPNGDWIWLSVWLKALPDPKVPGDKCKQLLKINDEWGPGYFAYNEANNMFRFKLPIYNRGIKPALLKGMLSLMDSTLSYEDAAKAWDPDKWSEKPKKEDGKGK